MLDAEARALLDLMEQAVQAGRPKLETLPYKDGRAAVDKMSEESEAEPLAVGEVDDGAFAGPAGEIRFRHYVPLVAAEGKLPTLIYYHGGGFVIGNLETHDSTCRRLANKSRCQVIAIDYRLAPEHPFPQGIDDSWAALRWVGENASELGGDASRIAVAGDSAGGNISAVMTQLARDNGGPALVFQLLWYPTTTGDLTLPSMIENPDGPILDQEVVAAFMQWYLPPEIDMSEPAKLPPTLAPANTADLSGLPPAFIGTAEHDPIRDDGARYAELLSAAGVPVELYNAPTLVHGYVSFALVVPAAAEAANRGLAALKAALHPG